jgi:hypothetical protein
MSDLEKLREALAKIAEIAGAAANSDVNGDSHYDSQPVGVCTPKFLPANLQVRAAKTARDINPMNAPFTGPTASLEGGSLLKPEHIAVLTSKYWGPTRRRLTVSFTEQTPSDLRTRIISHLNAWGCGIQYAFTTGTGQVRISRGAGGYWSYLGTDILHIATNRQTMNLEGFTMNTPESEFKRVIRHEGGHTLGFPHEHMRRQLVALIDPEKAYRYFQRTQGWSRTVVDQQVLTPLDDASIFATPPDQTSIMCYQLPGEITKNGTPIIGGLDINATDRAFGLRIYPNIGFQQSPDQASWQSYFDASGTEGEAEDDSAFVMEPARVDQNPCRLSG